LPADYTEAIAGTNVDRIVFVQAECVSEQATAEAEWVASLADDDPRIQGIVATAPLELGDAVLPTLESLAQNRLLKGIRRYAAGEQDPEFLLRADFVQGVRHLAKVDFACDLGIHRGQIPAATELARRCPDVRFVLCHLGVPDVKNQQLDPWREHIKALAELPNTYCKLSGVATAADHENWTREDLAPAIHHMFDCFGFERVAFGSDWPVMLLATTFPRWVETVRWVVRDCTVDELRSLFRATAEKIYRL
jgi:L-fuconolactonase